MLDFKTPECRIYTVQIYQPQKYSKELWGGFELPVEKGKLSQEIKQLRETYARYRSMREEEIDECPKAFD